MLYSQTGRSDDAVPMFEKARALLEQQHNTNAVDRIDSILKELKPEF